MPSSQNPNSSKTRDSQLHHALLQPCWKRSGWLHRASQCRAQVSLQFPIIWCVRRPRPTAFSTGRHNFGCWAGSTGRVFTPRAPNFLSILPPISVFHTKTSFIKKNTAKVLPCPHFMQVFHSRNIPMQKRPGMELRHEEIHTREEKRWV